MILQQQQNKLERKPGRTLVETFEENVNKVQNPILLLWRGGSVWSTDASR